jgi:hypothetical protein
MYSPPELVTMIEQRLRELGMSQTQLGQRAFGKADNTAIQSLKKGSSPAIDRLEAMARALGWEIYFGPPRLKSQTALHLAEPPAPSDVQRADAFRGGYLPLPWLDPKEGDGAAPVAFAHAWMVANGLIPDNLRCLNPDAVQIDGFEASKMLAVIDVQAPREGYGIWAIDDAGKRIVARALISDEMLVIQPARLCQTPRPVTGWRAAGPKILGRVAWIGCRPPA